MSNTDRLMNCRNCDKFVNWKPSQLYEIGKCVKYGKFNDGTDRYAKWKGKVEQPCNCDDQSTSGGDTSTKTASTSLYDEGHRNKVGLGHGYYCQRIFGET